MQETADDQKEQVQHAQDGILVGRDMQDLCGQLLGDLQLGQDCTHQRRSSDQQHDDTGGNAPLDGSLF